MSELEVTTSDLTSKAQTVSTPRPTEPGEANAPDDLAITQAAMSQLLSSATTMKTTLAAGDVEALRIAGALNATAAAYEKMDAANKGALDGEMDGDTTTVSTESVVPDTSAIPDSMIIACPAYPASGEWDIFTSWQTAARTIHSGDTQALSVKYLRDQWKAYKQSLTDHAANFGGKPAGWEGDAADTCDASMKSLHSWWIDMGDECQRLGEEAEKLADAHDKLVADHPTMDDVETFNSTKWLAVAAGPFGTAAKAAQWQWFQARSELALREYANSTGLMEIRPGKPPAIGGVPAVNAGEVTPKSNDDPTTSNPTTSSPSSSSPSSSSPSSSSPSTSGTETPDLSDLSSVSPASTDTSSGEESSSSPSTGSGSPSSGSQGSGTPSTGMPTDLPTGTEDMPEIPGLDEPSLTPASAGGGGAGMGGGGGGMGASPMGPAVGADSVAASPSAARGGGGGVAGAPGGTGGMGMGGGMGGLGAGHGQGQGKEKRRNAQLAEDEDLYKEDRAWTEAVIGRRARKDVKDTKG